MYRVLPQKSEKRSLQDISNSRKLYEDPVNTAGAFFMFHWNEEDKKAQPPIETIKELTRKKPVLKKVKIEQREFRRSSHLQAKEETRKDEKRAQHSLVMSQTYCNSDLSWSLWDLWRNSVFYQSTSTKVFSSLGGIIFFNAALRHVKWNLCFSISRLHGKKEASSLFLV